MATNASSAIRPAPASDHMLSVASVNLVLFAVRQRGLDPGELARAVGIDPARLRNPDERLPIRTMQHLWQEIVSRSGDPSIALSIGELVNPLSFGVLAYVMMHCPSLGQAFQKLIQYQDIVCEGIRTSGRHEGSAYVLSLQLTSPDIVFPAYAVESELSIYLAAMRALTGQTLVAREVWFAYPRPIDTSQHERVFGPTQLRFDAPESALIIDSALLDTPILNASPGLFTLFEQQADESMKRLKTPALTERVRTEILVLMKGEEPTLAAVADRLAMGIRTLQLHLKSEQTSYQQILDRVRRDMAIKHLREPHFSTTDIAYLLGFAEPSVFFRSFRKWTGQTPGAYRQQLYAS